MAEARGENTVRSEPRCCCSRSWFFSMLSRISSSEMAPGRAAGAVGSLMPQAARRGISVRGRRRRVVTVTVDDHRAPTPCCGAAAGVRANMASSMSASASWLRAAACAAARTGARRSRGIQGSRPASATDAHRLAHLRGTPAPVLQGARDHVARELAPVSAGKEVMERVEHRLLDAMTPRRQQ